ncbi:alpha/beta fold hydrolase [Cryptosporangium phraense]|uniref:Alpha/beta hydrolase n=1 Tax=Cryptosporangium phraense TaxID=2593070 RepID=A0A545ATY1_9ACTN|nr:alpha/beta hydrolase [Cryptosporangium phraense]TQS44786.1 alpha/beta hydrolase [Cryptosporangium phraense]
MTPHYTERGAGRPILLLHGGAGPFSVTGYAERLAAELPARVITPTHPGFDGTPRPDDLTTIGGLADVYVDFLDALDLTGVTVVGNSIGGWIAAEIGLRRSPRVDRLVLVDAVGLQVPGRPVADFFNLTFPQVAELSYYDPDAFRIDPDALPPAARAALAGNREALAVYAAPMEDPTLRDRLAAIDRPTLVVWGDSDRIVTPEYGRAYADAIPGARFELLPKTGHLPQLESPDLLTALLAS